MRLASQVFFSDTDCHFTYLVDIGDQTLRLGEDPELADSKQILSDVGWKNFEDLSEMDKAFLWASGLITFSSFQKRMGINLVMGK